MKAAILLSIGTHPASGWPRAADADLAALELVRRSGLTTWGIHAGTYHDALREYGGFGLERLTVIPGRPHRARAQFLANHVASNGVQVLVAGARGEAPTSDGMLPYEVARELGWPVIVNMQELTLCGTKLGGTAWLDAGTRRKFPDVRRTVVIARALEVSASFAASQAERLQVDRTTAAEDPCASRPQTLPARTREVPPPWMFPDPHASATTRLRSLRGEDGNQRRSEFLVDASPEQAASRLLQLLRDHRLLPLSPEGEPLDD